MAAPVISTLDANQVIRAYLTPGPTLYIGQGTVTSSGTAQQITSTSTAISSVVIKALKANTGKIYVWNASGNGTTNGFELSADDSVTISVDDLSKVWIDASTASQSFCYLAS